jgi:hypothetical protein
MTPALTPHRVMRLVHVSAIALTLSALPGSAAAQQGETDPSGALVGPLGVTPRIGWQADYEDNVFRTDRPVSDVVSTLRGGSGVRVRMRRVALTGNASAEWVHFARLISERGANVDSGLKLDFMFNRVVPYASTSYDNSRDRRNTEIDTMRPRTRRSGITLGSLFRLGGKTAVDLAVTRSIVGYEQEELTEGVNISEALNRASDRYSVTFLQDVTPLTRLTFTGEVQRDLFDTSSFRDSDEIQATAGFRSDGIVKGHARAGMRVQKPHNPLLPELRGIFLSVATNVTLLDRLQIGIDAERDTAPSYRTGVAFYESSAYGASVTYVMRPSVRLLANVSQYFADYRHGKAGLTASAEVLGVERETRYGTGIRFGLGQSMSFDLYGYRTDQTSVVASRRFESLNLRAGVSHAF